MPYIVKWYQPSIPTKTHPLPLEYPQTEERAREIIRGKIQVQTRLDRYSTHITGYLLAVVDIEHMRLGMSELPIYIRPAIPNSAMQIGIPVEILQQHRYNVFTKQLEAMDQEEYERLKREHDYDERIHIEIAQARDILLVVGRMITYPSGEMVGVRFEEDPWDFSRKTNLKELHIMTNWAKEEHVRAYAHKYEAALLV
jgi:hypothetical protein